MTHKSKKYAVFYRFRIESESVEDDVIHNWEYIAETIADSEEQAINTVRYYYFGKVRQYYPVDVSEKYESYFDWKVEVI